MKIAVAGTGYVGLVTGVALAHIGHDVTCVDIDENKISLMRQGISPIYEENLEELMNENKERLTYTTDYKEAAELVNIIKPEIVIPMHYAELVGTKEDATKFEELVNSNIQVDIQIK